MKKVLIITHAFPPSNSVSVHRVLRFGKWLPHYGWEPVILTPKYYYAGRYDRDNLKIAEKYFSNIFRSSYEYERYIEILRNDDNRSLVARVFRHFVLRKILPDRFMTWLPAAVHYGKKITQDMKIDAIWATMLPPTSGFAGAVLKKKTGVPLLLDYRDPWTLTKLNQRRNIRINLNIALERRMLQLADMVTVTSKPMRELFIDRGYVPPEKITVLTNGMDEELQGIYQNNEEIDIDENKINITYAGSFYNDRVPYSFIKGLGLLVSEYPELRGRLKINFVGNKGCQNEIEQCCKNEGVFELFHFIEIVSYSISMKYLQESDILYLLNGETKKSNIYIPGKLFDYLSVKKPILFVGEGQPSEIINKVNIGIAVPHDPEKIKCALYALIMNKSRYIYNENEYNKYCIENIAAHLAQILNRISKKIYN